MEFTERAHQDSAGGILARAAGRASSIVSSMAWTTLRLALYSVLAILEPVIVWITAALTIVCLALCVFFGLIVHAPHFPLGLVLLLGVGSALALVVYYALMGLLLPE